MPVQDLPESIQIYESDRDYLHDELDFSYISDVASDIAAILAARGVAETAYQPGDGTRYNLVIVPLALLEYARPRVVGRVPWDRHAVSGVKEPTAISSESGSAYYGAYTFLVALVDGPCYPLRLGDRGVLGTSYVYEKWMQNNASAVSLALLLRAVDFHLSA